MSLSDGALRSLGAKLDKLKDPNGFKHRDLLRDQEDDQVLWELIRKDLVLNAPVSAGLIGTIAELSGEASAGDLIHALRRMPDDMRPLDKGAAADFSMLTPGVLADVDRMIVRACALDPASVRALRDAVSSNMRLAIDFVRRRAGETIDEESSRAIFEHLLERHCRDYGLNHIDVPLIRAGEVIENRLGDADDVRRLMSLLAAEDEWPRAMLAWVRSHVIPFREMSHHTHLADALRRAELRDLVYLHAGGGSWNESPVLALLESRRDAPAELFEVALELMSEGNGAFRIDAEQAAPVVRPTYGDDEEGGEASEDYGDDETYDYDDFDDFDDFDGDDGYVGDGDDEGSSAQDELDGDPDSDRLPRFAQLMALAGILKTDASRVPEPIDSLITLQGVYESERPFIARLRAALRVLGETRSHEITRRAVAQPYFYGRSIAIADVWFDEALMTEVLDRIDRGDYRLDAGLAAVADPRLIPLFAERAERATDPERGRAYREAILYLASSKETDPAWDRHLDLGAINFSYGGSKVDPVLAMLRSLPLDRWEKVMRANMSRTSEPWRLVRCLRLDAPHDLLAEIFAAVVKSQSTVSSGAFGYSPELGARCVEPLAAALEGVTPEASFMREVERFIGSTAYQALTERLSRPVETKEEEMIRLASSIAGPKLRIYLLERGEAVDELEVARIGGTPRGVVDVPEHDGEPMTHVLTLDLSQMPHLADRLQGARAVSLYLPDPDYGQHHDSGRLVLVNTDELDRAPGSTANACALKVRPLDVPAEMFGPEPKGDLARLRGLVYGSAGFAGGGPIWMQRDEYGLDSTFLFQFDESLCHINLGDAGILYVLTHQIEFQCH